MKLAAFCALCLLSVAAAPVPRLVITEIQYDPRSEESDDQQTEWIEIANFGRESLSLRGFQITSGSKAKPHDAKQRFVLGDVSIAPNQHLVIGIGTPAAYKDLDLPEMSAYAGETKYAWLTNDGDSVAIRDARGNVIDEVVYEIESPWPIVKGSGSSLQFLPPAKEDPTVANDDAKNWTASDSTNSEAFADHGRGTPGKPATQPSALAKKK